MFHLEPPPGFRGLDPDIPVDSYNRHLPHWRQEGATYFATFRLADSLPQEKLSLLKQMREEWEQMHSDTCSDDDWVAYAREVTRSVERWLDEGYGACCFRERRWVEALRDRLNCFNEERYFLPCWAIMPNHCHILIRPFEGHDLEDLIGVIKGVTARTINMVNGTRGVLWEEESYDRIVRDGEHLWRVIQYMGKNPRKAGLQDEAHWRRWIHPDWKAAGWGFDDSE